MNRLGCQEEIADLSRRKISQKGLGSWHQIQATVFVRSNPVSGLFEQRRSWTGQYI